VLAHVGAYKENPLRRKRIVPNLRIPKDGRWLRHPFAVCFLWFSASWVPLLVQQKRRFGIRTKKLHWLYRGASSCLQWVNVHVCDVQKKLSQHPIFSWQIPQVCLVKSPETPYERCTNSPPPTPQFFI
jgi:hypothetical protein